MRPHAITLQNFGPYTEHTVDLEPFHDAGLFLVHGDTGAGKSTLLDAMSWALYGRGLGDRATDDMLRNVAAPPDAPTSVTLDFSLAERRYRVVRSVEPERISRRGTATRARASASLVCLAGDPRFEPVGGVKDVAREVVRLLQLPHEQFSRVIVLPQGEFRDLLLAPAERRERLLEHLFGTARYAQIEEQLRAMDSSARADFEKADGVFRALLEGVGASDLADLDAKVAEARERLGATEAAIAVGRAELLAAAAAGAAAATVEHRNRLRHEHREALAALAAGAADEGLAAVRLARDEVAAGCLDRVTTARALDASLAERHDRHRRALADYARLAEALTDPTLDPAAMESAEAEIRATMTRVAELRATVDEATRGAALADDCAARHAEAERAATAVAAREAALTDAVRTLGELDAAIAAHEAALTEESAVRARVENLSARQQRAVDRRTREDALRGLQRARRDALAVEREAESGWRALVEEQSRSEAAARATAAAHLAAALVAGSPCPVCGSPDHPSPHARGVAPVAAPTDAAAVATAAAIHVRAQREAFASQIRIEEAEVALRAGDGGEAVDEDALAGEIRAGNDALATLRRRRLDLNAARRARAATAAGADTQRTSFGVDQATLAGLRARAAAAAEGVARRAASIGGDLSPAALALAVQASEAEVAARQTALREARARRENTTRAAAVAEGSLPTLGAEVERATALRDEAAAAVARALVEGGFADVTAVAAAVLDAPERRRLRDAIELRARAEAAHREALATLGADEPAAATSARTEDVVRGEIEALQRDLGVAQSAMAAMAQQRRALLAAGEARDAAEVKGGRVRRVAEVANGKGPTRVRLSRYVLLDLFDRVVASASAGLETMSDGRFRLRRHERAQTGREFDLVVDDSYVGGAARPAASLSGGEVFLASLAMALGLGEVLQAWAGGIRVESLFVDEGFGALDEDTVERAIELLERLPQHARMVGVVSHVPELRKRIPARLEVLRGDRGSFTRCSLRHRGDR